MAQADARRLGGGLIFRSAVPRAAIHAETRSVSAPIGGDSTVTAYQVTLAPVTGNLRAAASEVSVGAVGGYAFVTGEDVTVDGLFGGDAVLGADAISAALGSYVLGVGLWLAVGRSMPDGMAGKFALACLAAALAGLAWLVPVAGWFFVLGLTMLGLGTLAAFALPGGWLLRRDPAA
ncbi:MAG: hypothetical protein CFE32_05630 [Alphaproteobacteria bacterium PA3]|nr:MAG: hypothetical protein CFE32_05630 [Alphaproteobacteria bacterium PA3]